MNPHLLRVLATLLFLLATAAAADRTWDGGSGADDDWTTNQNWGNNNEPNGTSDSATMAGVVRLTPNLDADITLNRLTFAATAGNFTIGGASTLTLGGSNPLIEVLTGSQTISCPFALAADLTVYVAAGTTLTISDAAITGTGRITKVGTGTLTVTDSAAPAAPSWVAPASAGQLTGDTTPTWTWSAGGAGVYRYRLDGGAWTDTTATTFTPSGALGNGVRTLEVEAYGRTGVLSPTASRAWTIDGSAPAVVTRITRDLDADGRIDAIEVTFSETMSTADTGTWEITGPVYAIASYTWTSSTLLRLVLTEQAAPDTGILPLVRYDAGTITDAAGNALPIEGAGTKATDGAAPVITTALGTFPATSLTVQFSEPVVSTNLGAGNLSSSSLELDPANTITAFADANGLDQAVTFTVANAVNNGATVRANASQVYDLAGNEMGVATTAVTQPIAARETAQAGNWDDPATWVGNVVPGYFDHVVLRHAVTVNQPGASYEFREVRTLTFESGGSLVAANDVISSGYYTILYLNERLVEANASATVTNVQLYDGGGSDFIVRVGTGATLTLNNTNQGHFVRSLVKQGAGRLVWNSPANSYGGFDLGPTRIEGGVFQLNVVDGRPSGYEWSVLTGATLETQVSQTISLLTGQGTISRFGATTPTLTLSGSSWGGAITGPITVSASGNNIWSGINTFTGGLNLTGGSLSVQGGQAIADSCPVSVAVGATLTVTAAEVIGALADAGTIVLDANLGIYHGTSASSFTGSLSGSGLVTITGLPAGAQTFTGTNTHAGGLILGSGGTATISSNEALGATGAPLVFAGGRLRLGAHVNLTSALVQTTADGTGPNAVLAVQGAPAANRPVSVTADDGIIELGAFSLALPAFSTAVGQDLTIIGNGTTGVDVADPALFVVVDAGTTTWAGQLDAGSAFGFLCKRGAGTLAITNPANTWAQRVVRAEQGTLVFGASGALGTVGDWVYVLPGATGRLDDVVYAGAPTLYLSGTLGVAGTSSWQGPTWLWTSTPAIAVDAAARLTLDGTVVSNSATSLTKSGAGTLALTQANSFVLPVTVSGGRLEVAADSHLGNAANAITLAGGTLAATSGFASARGFTLGGGGTIEVAASQTLTLNGVVGGGALTKSGAGELVLAAVNTFTAGTTIAAGTLSIGSATALGDVGSGVTFAGGTLRTTASAVLAGRPVAVGAGGGTIEVAAGTLELPATVSGSGTLTKTASGTLVLSGANTLSGPIAVQAGTLSARSNGALGTTAGATGVASGASLELHGDVSNAEPLTLAGTGVGGLGALQSAIGTHALSGAITLVQTVLPVAIAVEATADLTLSGALGGAGGWRKLGSGTLTLNAANGFSGDVAVESGTLALGADNRLGQVGNQVLLDGGSLLATATFTTTRTVRIGSAGGAIIPAGFAITLPGVDTVPGQTLTLTGPGTVEFAVASTRNLSGVLAGDADLLKSGAGTLVVGNAGNTFTGTTTVTGGVLLLGGSLPGAITLDSTGELTGNGSGGATTVLAGGRLSPGGVAAGVLTLASLDMQAAAELAANLGSASDLVAVSGAATVRGTLTMIPGGGFVDGTYTLINAAGGVTYADGDMVLLPNPAPPPRFRLSASSDKLLLTRDGADPVITAITSTSPDGDYITGDSVNVRVVFSEPVNLVDGLELTLNTVPAATVTIAPSISPTTFASEFDGTYTVAAPEESADLSVDAIVFVGGGSFTDVVGNTVSGALALPGQNLGALKNIAIVNLPPVVEINNDGAGNTTPVPFAIGSPGSTVMFSSLAVPPADELSVQATDAETPDPSDLTWTLLLEPSQGVLERLNGASWDTVTLGTDFSHQQIVDGEVRYRHTASVGGNDALLLQCRDPQSNDTPLFLVRFAVAGAGPPVVQNFLDPLTYFEPASKPGDYTAIDGDILVLDADSTDFATGDMLVSVLNGGALDQLDLLPDAVVVGTSVRIEGVTIGTVAGRATNALTFSFTAGATPASVTTLLKNIGYRYVGDAPTNTVGRALRVRIRDNALGSYAEVTKTVAIDPWNDPPTASAAVIATVPGLARSGTITRSDPEGLGAASIVLTRIQDPIRGTLTAWDPVAGTFTYQPDFLPAATPGDVVTDTFVVRATDLDFDSATDERVPSGSDATRTQERSSYLTVTINITQAGAAGLRFRNPARMTIAPGGNLLYIPEIESPPGANLVFELIDAPAGPTVDGAGRVIWNGVTVPADGYHRFGLLMTDTVSGAATLLPIMLRVGPGGAG